MRLPLCLACLALSTPALADEPDHLLPWHEEEEPRGSAPETDPVVLPYLTVGGLEFIQIAPEGPAHLGFYAMMSLDLLFPIGDSRWTFITSTGFEVAPENANWGFYEFLIMDYRLGQVGTTVVTIEPQVGLVHNAAPLPGGGFDHALYPSAGVGMAFLTKDGAGPALIPTITASYGLRGEGLSMAMMGLVSIPID